MKSGRKRIYKTKMPLDFEIIPELGLATQNWEVRLGSPIGMVINIFKKATQEVKQIDLGYSEGTQADITLTLTNDGVRFYFCPTSQRLRKIEIFDLTKCILRYSGIPITSKATSPTLSQIDSSFGATHPGEYCPHTACYLLTYRGIAFGFEERHPLPDAVVQSCSIFDGSVLAMAEAPHIPFRDVIHCERCEVGLDEHGTPDKLTFDLITKTAHEERAQEFTRVVRFGDFPQDVQTEIGCPDTVHYKSEDKMQIHLGHKPSINTDYFFNYFSLGVDLLFCGKTHQLKKFILHSNYPCHYDFSIYERCEFNIPISATTLRPELDAEELIIDPRTSWTEIQGRVCEPISKPVSLRRTSSANNTNPWGSTKCYSFGNMVYEVMPTDQIATVIIFNK